jgi:hypothetical protein
LQPLSDRLTEKSRAAFKTGASPRPVYLGRLTRYKSVGSGPKWNTIAQTLEHVLRACGDDLTRANVMRQAASLEDLDPWR